MKPKSTLRSFLILAGSSVLAASLSSAATYYWDNNAAAAGFGTAGGSWATGASLWNADTDGNPGPTGTITTLNTNATTDAVNFGNGATGLVSGTITVSGTVNSGNMTFASGSGAILLSPGTITLSAAQTTTVDNASNTIESVLAGAATSFTKAGSGTLNLTGANTYAGTTIVNAGTLNLGGGTATGSLTSTVLTLGGGAFHFTRNDNATQGFTTTNINSRSSSISVSAGNTLNLGAVTRGTGGTFDFSSTGAGILSALATSNVSGIMPGLTHGDSWAVGNGDGVAISALGSYTLTSVAGNTGANYSNNNIDVDSSAGTLDAAITTNSLRFSSAAANTLDLATGTNTISSSGILVGSAVGANLSTISGGTLTGAVSKDLSIIQKNASGGLTISSTIANNTSTSITKSGAGLLTLSGNNTFTGGLTIHAGSVALGNAGALNSTAGSQNAVSFTSGSTGLALNGNSVVVRSLDSSVSSSTVENANITPVTLTIGNSGNANSTFAGIIQDGTGGGTLKLLKAGTGTLVLTGTNNNTFSGGFEINAGTVQYDSATNANAWGSSTNVITFTGNATLYNSNNAYTLARGIAINGVTANLTGAFGESTNVTGAVTGTGTLNVTGASNGWAVTLSNTGNTFTGAVGVYGGSGSASLNVASLGSSANAITLSTGNNGAGSFTYTGSAALSRALALNGTTSGGTFNSSGSGVITISPNLSITANGAKTLTLGGGNTGANTFSGSIGNSGAGATAITKADGGRWILSNTANTYTGITTISGGILEVTKLDDGSSNSSIGASGSGAGNLLLGNGATLRYTGSGDDTNRGFTINVASNNHGAILDASGTGAVEFTNTASPAYGTTNQPRTLTLTGTNTGNNTLAANLADNGVSTNAVSISKTSIGTWVLTGANANTGNTTISGGGKLILDYGVAASPQDSSKIAGVLTLNNGGGDLTLRGGSHVEAVTSTSMTTGGGHTHISREVGSTATLTLGAISRSQSGGFTSSLAADNLATTTTANFTGRGMLGGGITVGSNWAKNDGSGNIVALTALDYTALPTGATTGTVNYELSGSQTHTGSSSMNSLRIVGTGVTDQSLDLGANQLQVGTVTGAGTIGNSGGLLYAGGGTDNYTITGTNSIQGQNGNQELIIHTHTGNLTLDIAVSTGTVGGGAGLTKSGVGTLILNKASVYTSATFVNQGTLLANNTTGSATGTGAVTVHKGAALGGTGTVGGSTTIAAGGGLTFDLTTASGSHDKLELASGKTLTFSGTSTLTITSSGGTPGTGTYTLLTAPSGITGSVPTVILPGGWAGTASIVGNDLLLNVTSVGGGGPGPLDHFAISAISSPQTVGTPITGITLTAQDASNVTVTGFTGTVTFGGTGGFTGTSASFVLGVLSGVSVTPTNAGSGLTFTVDDGASHTGSATITTIQTQYQFWAGGALFDADANGDGVKNGLAFLLGASGPNVSALDKLPTVTQSSGNLVLNFKCLNAAKRGSSVLKVQYSKDLGITDLWTSHFGDSAAVPGTAPTTVTLGGVDFISSVFDADKNNMQATIPVSAASPGTKLFGRLKAEQP